MPYKPLNIIIIIITDIQAGFYTWKKRKKQCQPNLSHCRVVALVKKSFFVSLLIVPLLFSRINYVDLRVRILLTEFSSKTTEVHICGFDLNVLTALEWIAVTQPCLPQDQLLTLNDALTPY